jgi:uncharacterized protein YdaU (DUF1376 family)
MRLTGLWWWIDRWRKSSAYMDMTLEQQGAYRNLLDEAALRGGPLPTEDRILAKACGDAKRWPKVRAIVLARFELKADGWHNATLDAVIARSAELAAERSAAGKRGAAARWQTHSKPDSKPDGKTMPSGSGSVSYLPPIVPQRGTFTKRELEHAAQLRSRSLGGCPHSPRCVVYRDCLALIAADVKAAVYA